MATYLELKAQAEKLLAQAEEVRVKEINDVISDIKQKVDAYGLSASDLGLRATAQRKPRKPAGGKAVTDKAPAAAAKYRGPNGETWAGGRGRKPKWVAEYLAKGKKLEDLLIK